MTKVKMTKGNITKAKMTINNLKKVYTMTQLWQTVPSQSNLCVLARTRTQPKLYRHSALCKYITE
jgi:hypothetical protein